MKYIKVRRKADGAIIPMTVKAYNLLPRKERNWEVIDQDFQEVKKKNEKDAEPVYKEIIFEDEPDVTVTTTESDEVLNIDLRNDLNYLRSEFKELSGKKADKRWKEERLKEEINKVQNETN